MKLSLEKSGSFQSNFQTGSIEGKCGLPMSNSYEYFVRVNGTDKRLSPEGFIIENSRIQSYFDNTYALVTEFRSCELIASKAAKAIGEKLVSEKISVESVEVTISGTPGAKLSAAWQKSKGKEGK